MKKYLVYLATLMVAVLFTMPAAAEGGSDDLRMKIEFRNYTNYELYPKVTEKSCVDTYNVPSVIPTGNPGMTVSNIVAQRETLYCERFETLLSISFHGYIGFDMELASCDITMNGGCWWADCYERTVLVDLKANLEGQPYIEFRPVE